MHKLILLFLFASFFESIEAQPTQFRGADRNGIYPATVLLDMWPEQGPELITSIEGIGDGNGSYGDAFCLNLVILTPGGPGQNVVALDKMTGEQI